MDTGAWLLCSVISGSFGLGYFVYGKKQQKYMAMVCGAGLMVYPYFTDNWWLTIGIGVVLIALPFIFRF